MVPLHSCHLHGFFLLCQKEKFAYVRATATRELVASVSEEATVPEKLRRLISSIAGRWLLMLEVAGLIHIDDELFHHITQSALTAVAATVAL